MTRNITAQLEHYAEQEVEVRRIALNLNQVRRYRLPPNFAKEDKIRAAYVREFGTDQCWELDALSPTVISNLIEAEIKKLIDPEEWNAAKAKEQRGRDLIDGVATHWTKVEKLVGKLLKQ